jgi:ATP-dependent Clp protease ATP-binding subunit ClpX
MIIAGLYFCDFCGKEAEFVDFMVRGRKACICNECIKVCQDIAEERKQNNEGEGA